MPDDAVVHELLAVVGEDDQVDVVGARGERGDDLPDQVVGVSRARVVAELEEPPVAGVSSERAFHHRDAL